MILPTLVLMLHDLWCWLCDRALLKSDLSSCKQSSVHHCAGVCDNLLCTQDIAIERRVSSESCTGAPADLPEDISGFGAIGKYYLNAGKSTTGSDIEISRYLENPDSVRVALCIKGDIPRVYCNIGAPFIEAGIDSFPAQISNK